MDAAGNKATNTFTYTIGTSSPTTDFRSETIYFVLTARFNDGDPSNNYYNRPSTRRWAALLACLKAG